MAEFTHYIYAVLHCKPAKHFQNAASGCEWLSSASAMHVCACMCLFVCLFSTEKWPANYVFVEVHNNVSVML